MEPNEVRKLVQQVEAKYKKELFLTQSELEKLLRGMRDIEDRSGQITARYEGKEWGKVDIRDMLKDIPSGEFKKETPRVAVPVLPPVRRDRLPRLGPYPKLPLPPDVKAQYPLGAGARRLLAALVSWSPNGMLEGQWRSHAGLRKSGTFSTYKSALRSANFIEQRTDGLFYATQAGIEHMGDKFEQAPSTTEEVLALWNPKLGAGARRILDALVQAGGEALSQEELTEKTGLQKSGTFSTYISALRTAQLVIRKDGGFAANKETLFL
jgi:hypothetical protein